MEKIIVGALIIISACSLPAKPIFIPEKTTVSDTLKYCISNELILRTSLDAPSAFCLNLTVVEEKRTWEGALRYCKQSQTDLASLLSKDETSLAQSKIQQNSTTERVWIGLRYLGDRWLWVNGDPLIYEAWPQDDQDYQCPMWKRCGALTKEGLWENWNCDERLNFICV